MFSLVLISNDCMNSKIYEFFFDIVGISVLARINSRFYHGIQTTHTEDTVAVFFKESSPRFLQLYDKKNINQIVYTPVNISELSPDIRILIETNTDFAVLGTIMGEYLRKNNNSSSSTTNIKSNASKSNINDIDRRLVNLTIRLDEGGDDFSVTNKKMWLLPVQMEDKGVMTILRLYDDEILRVV